MRSFLMCVVGFMIGSFLGSMLFKAFALYVFGINIENIPLIFKFFPYLMGFILAVVLPVIDNNNQRKK